MGAREISIAVSMPGTQEMGLTPDLSASESLIGAARATWLDEDGVVKAILNYSGSEIASVDLYSDYGEDDWKQWHVLPDGSVEYTYPVISSGNITHNTTNIDLDLTRVKGVTEVTPGISFFNTGIEVDATWTDENGTSYDCPMTLVGYEWMVKEEHADIDRESWVAVFLSKYATKNSLPYDALENESPTEETMQEGVSYIGYRTSTGKLEYLGTGQEEDSRSVPTAGSVYSYIRHRLSEQPHSGGYARWRYSTIRQYLNSDAAAGEWWTAQHVGDCAPDNLAETRGWLAGLDSGSKAALACVRIGTKFKRLKHAGGSSSGSTSTVQDEDITYDKVWLPSLDQMRGVVNSDREDDGGAWEDYWTAKGISTASDDAANGRIFCAIEDTGTAVTAYIRTYGSTYQGYQENVAGRVLADGGLLMTSTSTTASPRCDTARRCIPAFAVG